MESTLLKRNGLLWRPRCRANIDNDDDGYYLRSNVWVTGSSLPAVHTQAEEEGGELRDVKAREREVVP